MLYITTQQRQYMHHIGSKFTTVPADLVQSVQADGHELDQIHSWGFPNNGERVQHFYGDMAKYIVGNWK